MQRCAISAARLGLRRLAKLTYVTRGDVVLARVLFECGGTTLRVNMRRDKA